jgi:hypothetical protein
MFPVEERKTAIHPATSWYGVLPAPLIDTWYFFYYELPQMKMQ